MWTTLKIVSLSLLGLIISSVRSSSSLVHDLEFYKAIDAPWYRLEEPKSIGGSESGPVVKFTWDFYFNYLTDMGVRNFLLGGYTVKQSKVDRVFQFYPPWDKAGFKALKERIKAKGGNILADLGIYTDRTFDKTAFLESVRKFIEDYPVDGFHLGLHHAHSNAARSLRKVLKAIRRQKLHCSFCTDWQIVKDRRLGRIADTYFVLLWPLYDAFESVFNTDNFAEEAIKNVTLAGVRRSKLALTIPLIATVTNGARTGYSFAIFDFKGDPEGNGSVTISPHESLYFFSQTRAMDKITLARKHGLHGIALQGSNDKRADLHPWDPRSLLYALVMNI